MYNIIVCMKLIMDPEMPYSVFELDRENKRPIPPSGVPPVFSPFDENALEAALRLKDEGEFRITVLCLGNRLPKAIMQKALALGADEVISIDDALFNNLDPFNTARVLANAVKKIEKYDLIFMGRQAADWDAGLVWAGVAEFLNIPSVTIARSAEVHENRLIVERIVSDGIEFIETDMPALVTFSSEAGELRNMSLKALMNVKKQEIPKWTATDLEYSEEKIMDITDLTTPDLKEIDCYFVTGNDPLEKGRNLARKLFKEKII